jgi:hypothetical protein
MSRLAASNEITGDRWGVETTKGASEEYFRTEAAQKPSLTTSNRPAKTQGYAVEEEVNEEDGSIRLVVRKWVSE